MADTAYLRTTTLPTGLRIAQVVGLTSTALLAGKTFAQTVSAIPALLHAPAPLLAKQWKTMFDGDKLLAPIIVLYSSSIFGYLAWRDRPLATHPSLLYTTATALLLTTIPYSLLLLEPLNQKLEEKALVLSFKASEAGQKQEHTVHWLVDRWGTVNLGRAVIAAMAAGTAVWGAVGGVRIGGVVVGRGVGR